MSNSTQLSINPELSDNDYGSSNRKKSSKNQAIASNIKTSKLKKLQPSEKKSFNALIKSLRVSKPFAPASMLPKRNMSRLPGINLSKSQIDRFKQQYEKLFELIDDPTVLNYQASDEMIEPYITANKLDNSDELATIGRRLFKSHRYLLYLDQFIAFIISSKHNEVLSSYIDNNYFNLPIASLILKNAFTSVNKDLVNDYSTMVYKSIAVINDSNIGKSREINNVSIISCHGGLISPHIEFIKVPDDVIIAFPTPLNRYLIVSFTYNMLFDIIKPYKTNNDFLKNPACYFRGDNCLQYTIYYYPGQLIPNFIFNINTSISWENKIFGFFPDNVDTNQRDILFNKNTGDKLTTDIKTLFATKLELLKNKITYINCCRRCDSYIPNKSIEFLYRYEHIINYLNISSCLSIDSRVNSKCDETIFTKVEKQNTLSDNNTKHPYFYDPVLLSTFKSSKTVKKHLYLDISQEKWLNALENLNKLIGHVQLEYFDEIFRSLMLKINDNPELFGNRIFELFSKTKITFNLTRYLMYRKCLTVINNKFIDYNISYIFDNIFNAIYDNITADMIFVIEKINSNINEDNDPENILINMFISKIKTQKNIIDKVIINLQTKYDPTNQLSVIASLTNNEIIYILYEKLRLLSIFNSESDISNIMDKSRNSNTNKFIKIVYLYYFKLMSEGSSIMSDMLVESYNIYTEDVHGNKIYMFSPDSNLEILNGLSLSTDIKLNKFLSDEKSPLLYLIFLAMHVKVINSELIAKLYDVAIEQYKNKQSELDDFKNKYLHVFIYMLVHAVSDKNSIDIVYEYIYKLLDITVLYPKFTDLYFYISVLMNTYMKLPFSKLFDTDEIIVNILNPNIPTTQKHNKLPKHIITVCYEFLTKFESQYSQTPGEKELLGSLSYDNKIFNRLFKK
jgi:hypothetical protein